jgi:hypothetical protein
MEQVCRASSNIHPIQLFEAVTVLEMSQIAGLKVHRGKDPSVELIVQQPGGGAAGCRECKPGKECKDHPHCSARSLGILFPGDMERQRFVEAVIEFHEQLQEGGGEDEDESDKDEEPGRDGEDGEGEEDEEKDVSDEEVVEAHLYE